MAKSPPSETEAALCPLKPGDIRPPGLRRVRVERERPRCYGWAPARRRAIPASPQQCARAGNSGEPEPAKVPLVRSTECFLLVPDVRNAFTVLARPIVVRRPARRPSSRSQGQASSPARLPRAPRHGNASRTSVAYGPSQGFRRPRSQRANRAHRCFAITAKPQHIVAGTRCEGVRAVFCEAF